MDNMVEGYSSSMQTTTDISVSVVIPVYNEEKYIAKCIESVLKQDYPKEKMEVIFVDGNSSDRTREIMQSYVKKYPHLRVLNNPKKTVQYALNIGIRDANGKYIVRFDAHAEYAPDYVSKCIEYLEKTGADNVGGPTVVRGKTEMQNVIAAAYHSPFALGGGKCHYEDYEGYADTVSFGAYRKKKAIELGLYDENFPRSEDDEFNYRLVKNGGKIYITPQIKSVYYPRDNLKALFKQYFEYGMWKVAVIKKHKKPARISHLVPMCFVLFLIVFGVGSFISSYIAAIFGSVIVLYAALNTYYSLLNRHITGLKNGIMLFVVHLVFHVSYGLGFLGGIYKFLLKLGVNFKTPSP